MEDAKIKSTEEIIKEIGNATKKKKKKNNKKKNKKQNNITNSEATTDVGSVVAGITELRAEEGKLPSQPKIWDKEINKEVITQIVEDEKKEDGVVTRSKTANQNQKKNKEKQPQKVGGSLPKPVKEKEWILQKIELSDSFWEAYKSDYSDSDSDAESLDEYAKDGYHPVHVGETLNERYRVMKKLGWGAFSTVWFWHDLKLNKFVAVKVQKSGESYYSAAEDEIEILDVIASNWDSDDWKETIKKHNEVNNINSVHWINMLDHFIFTGPHGKHIGMVFEIMGWNLLKIMKQYEWNGIPVPIVRILAKQILLGIDYLHRLCDVIHTDIKPENAILWPSDQQLIDHLDSIPPQFKSHIKGKVETSMFFSKEQNEINKRKKKNAKKKNKRKMKNQGENNKANDDEKEGSDKDDNDEKNDGPLTEDVQVKICDFGNGWWTDHHFTSTIQTRQYRSPEVILGIEYDETWDLWSYAWMIFELVTGDYLFNPKGSEKFSKEEDHIAFIHELIGAPDVKWLKKAKRFRKYFTTKGQMKRIPKHKLWKLKDVLKEKYCFKDIEAEKLADFLMQALQWKNEDRASAEEMLDHEWLSMPADYNCREESDGEGENEDEGEGEESGNEDQTPANEESDKVEGEDEWETISTVSDSENSDNDDVDST